MASTSETALFDFMVVRPPDSVSGAVLRARYIRDGPPPQAGRDLEQDRARTSLADVSEMARLVYDRVLCDPTPPDRAAATEILLDELVAALPSYVPERAGSGTPGLPLGALERHAWVRYEGRYFLLPDRVEDLAEDNAYVSALSRVTAVLEGAAVEEYDAARLRADILALFGTSSVFEIVFKTGLGTTGYLYRSEFAAACRGLFEVLYRLYMLRRRTRVTLERIIAGLRALHTLQALAIDELYLAAEERGSPSAMSPVVPFYPELAAWDATAPCPGFPLIKTTADLRTYLTAVPVVHPIFASLYWYGQPFNDIQPLGVGDLKVVKTKLLAYEPGEISDIHNVMAGETKLRIHRRLEKAEDSFSSTSTARSESSTDTTSTDRYELKRESEQVIKTDLSVNANMSLQYTPNTMIHLTVGGGFSYNRSDTETGKLAQNFSHDVVARAASRVENSTVDQRSATRLFETEETNTHEFKAAEEHLSGIYRWVNKRYEAQVYNYGKRTMYEFVLPEPAAFFVQSRLYGYESTLEVPQPPKRVVLEAPDLKFRPGDIDEATFQRLRREYRLDMTWPAPTRRVTLINQETATALFRQDSVPDDDLWHAYTYSCDLQADGYNVDVVRLTGQIYFHQVDGDVSYNMNIVHLTIGGTLVKAWDLTAKKHHSFYADDPNEVLTNVNCPVGADPVRVTLGFQDLWKFALAITFELKLRADALDAWRQRVFDAVWRIEQQRADDVNKERRLRHDTDYVEYQNRIDELRASAVHDLLQGRSEAANQDLIKAELKRQCLSVFTKEFDYDATDDVLTPMETVQNRKVTVSLPTFKVTEYPADEDEEARTTGTFERWELKNASYAALDLPAVSAKGRHIQFLEQAFEWDLLAYVFYPYFWATPGKWVELMSRADDTDPSLTAFLQAGSVKVLVAVNPAYDDAVAYYLQSREPWFGGLAPALNDPLYLPMHEEVHRHQDDLYGATPEGNPWEFTLPTSLVYLEGSTTPLPDVADGDT
jgi:hypothetical protein